METRARRTARERFRTQRASVTRDQALRRRAADRARHSTRRAEEQAARCLQRMEATNSEALNASQSAEDVHEVAISDAEPPDPVELLADPAPHASASASVALTPAAAEAISEPPPAENDAPRRTNRRRNGPARWEPDTGWVPSDRTERRHRQEAYRRAHAVVEPQLERRHRAETESAAAREHRQEADRLAHYKARHADSSKDMK